MKEPARLVRRRFAEVVAYFEHPYANAVLEGADSVVRNVKRRACGFRDMDYFATMVLPDLRQARPQSRHHLPLSESFLQIGPYPHLVTACIITIILIVIQ